MQYGLFGDKNRYTVGDPMNQTEGIDATSKFQDSLPVLSDMLLQKLVDWQIEYQLFDHVPFKTVVESKKVQSLFRSSAQSGGHIKNLYLRDHKKRNILLVAEQVRQIDLKLLSGQLETGRLSFGSEDRLLTHLGVRPGVVTPLPMITGVKILSAY